MLTFAFALRRKNTSSNTPSKRSPRCKQTKGTPSTDREEQASAQATAQEMEMAYSQWMALALVALMP
jgi:hypothetical protein